MHESVKLFAVIHRWYVGVSKKEMSIWFVGFKNKKTLVADSELAHNSKAEDKHSVYYLLVCIKMFRGACNEISLFTLEH